MHRYLRATGCAAILTITLMGAGLAYAQAPVAMPPASSTTSPPAQNDVNKDGGKWTQGQNERRELREEREQIRSEHEELQAEHDRLKAHCMDAKGQDRSECAEKFKALHEKREALHDRMKALQTKIASARQARTDKWKPQATAPSGK